MVSLARASLRHEWRRYLAAVLAVTFAGLLVLVQLALLLGLFGTVSAVIDGSRADLWIGFRNTPSVDLGRALASGADSAAWTHPQVARVERYAMAFGDLRRADGVPLSVVVNAIDTSPHALAFSRLLSAGQRALLDEPDAILVDAADRDKLGAEVGSVVEINGRRARVAGTVKGIRAIGGINVLASYATARSIAPETREGVSFYLLALREGADPAVVARDLEDRRPLQSYSIWTAPAFSQQSQAYWLLESGGGIGSGFASLLALLVGIAITSQTLSGAVLASIKEFAALRALGVSRRALRAVVLEQAFWIGTIGLLFTAALTLGSAALGRAFLVPMAFPWWMLCGTAAVILAIALLSGLMSVRPLLRAEPASLLR